MTLKRSIARMPLTPSARPTWAYPVFPDFVAQDLANADRRFALDDKKAFDLVQVEMIAARDPGLGGRQEGLASPTALDRFEQRATGIGIQFQRPWKSARIQRRAIAVEQGDRERIAKIRIDVGLIVGVELL